MVVTIISKNPNPNPNPDPNPSKRSHIIILNKADLVPRDALLAWKKAYEKHYGEKVKIITLNANFQNSLNRYVSIAGIVYETFVVDYFWGLLVYYVGLGWELGHCYRIWYSMASYDWFVMLTKVIYIYIKYTASLQHNVYIKPIAI